MTLRKRSSTVERRKSILTQINEAGQVFVHELSKEFDVSEVTIRNDLEQLERKNMLIRARGGAIKAEKGVGIDYRLSDKDKLNSEEKSRIGRKLHSSLTTMTPLSLILAPQPWKLPGISPT